MNEDVFAGQWKQMRGELKTWWGRLADDDFDKIGGQKDKLIGLVQERYGYTRGDAEEEVERRFKEYSAKVSGGMARMAAKAQELGATATSKANEAATVVGEKMGSLAGVIREKAPREGSDSHNCNNSSGWTGIGEFLSAREKIRTSRKRPNRLGSQLPYPISVSWFWSWLFARATPEINMTNGLPTNPHRS